MVVPRSVLAVAAHSAGGWDVTWLGSPHPGFELYKDQQARSQYYLHCKALRCTTASASRCCMVIGRRVMSAPGPTSLEQLQTKSVDVIIPM